jgi:hypothetical protein
MTNLSGNTLRYIYHLQGICLSGKPDFFVGESLQRIGVMEGNVEWQCLDEVIFQGIVAFMHISI